MSRKHDPTYSYYSEELNSWMNNISNITCGKESKNESWSENTGMFSLYHANKWSSKGVYYPYKPEDEIINYRTRDTKTFSNNDGTYTAVFLSGLHYEGGDGKWKDIDLTVQNNNTGRNTDFVYCNVKMIFTHIYLLILMMVLFLKNRDIQLIC
jgi:hypothetical protein